jgi:hypothetical protein
MWLPDTHRTRMRAMRHRIITRGPPIRQPPMRLTGLDAQFTEDAMAEDAKRGQVERGHFPLGIPRVPYESRCCSSSSSAEEEGSRRLPEAQRGYRQEDLRYPSWRFSQVFCSWL